MARLRIELPPKALAVVSVPVRITDLNYGNHVGNHAIVEIIHEARVQFLQQHGYTELSVAGTSLIMSDLQVEFKNEAFYPDLLEIRLFAGAVARAGFDLFYQLSANRNGEKITIALGKTGMVCYDYTLKKVNSVPERLRQLLSS